MGNLGNLSKNTVAITHLLANVKVQHHGGGCCGVHMKTLILGKLTLVSNSGLFHGVVMLAVLKHYKAGQNGRCGGGWGTSSS